MFNNEIFLNLFLMLLCYAYTLLIIFVSSKLDNFFSVSRKVPRKFLHIMIGNLLFVIPFFTYNSFPLNFPFFVAAPFILVTFLASLHYPFRKFGKKLKGLADLTEEGHQQGLVFYAFSYTFLALFFATKPHVIAAGILPMAYGDALASLGGEKYGRRRYKIFAEKSLEGSMVMFIASFSSFAISLAFFSTLYPFLFFDKIFSSLAVALVGTLTESVSPKGFDNLTVPALCTLVFLLLGGGA
ncbi:MAG: phosphatidate cytidylyltransferase [Candidatus Bathyarchaeota archaeon]|nr:phosphatidate cytidylyltransferase [Candidatus Bathyarchaeota archaeon]